MIRIVSMTKDFPLERLVPYPENPRKNEQAVGAIEASLAQFGPVSPIIVDKQYRICAGHTRFAAAKKSGLTTFPVIICDFSDENEFKGYNIADNQTASIAEWDDSRLAAIIADLKAEDFPVESLGFDTKEFDRLATLAGGGALGDPDEVPEPPVDPISKTGDLWILGNHRLLCGDSTNGGDIALLMNGEVAALMNTDPPYGIGYVAGAKSKGQAVDSTDIENDDLDGAALQAFLESAIKEAVPFLTPNCAFYLWHPMLTQGTFFAAAAAAAAAAADILIHRQIIWIKPSLVFGRGDYHWQHELCFYGWRRGNRPPFYGERNQTTFWPIGRENDKCHPTQKPVELFSIPIRNHLQINEIAYEPFSGSGSQIIAAEQLNRRCYAIEIEPKYIDVAVERWVKFTGKDAKRESDGASWLELKARRAA